MIPRRRAYVYPGEYADIARWQRSSVSRDDAHVRAWERAVAAFVGVPHAVAVSSGRRGMTLILEHLGVRSGDEVIIPAYTLKDLIPLVQELGATPVPADVDPETFNVTPDTLARRMTPRTKAILALHVFGAPCPIEPIVALARDRNVVVIEDCAHSLGASVGGRQTGSFGRAAFFSLEPTKPVNTFGGGVVVSSDETLIEHVRRRTAGDVLRYDTLNRKVRAVRMERFLLASRLGFPLLYLLASPRWKDRIGRLYRSAQHVPPSDLRFTPIQAKIGLAKLAGLRERIALRAERVDLLRSLLRPGIKTQRVDPSCRSAWYFLVAALPCPAAPVRRDLLLHGIDAAIEEEIADDCAASLGYDDCPSVKHLFRHIIALPLFDGIPERAVARIARVLNKIVP